MAIGANTAAPWHGPGKTGDFPFLDAINLNVGCRADHVQRAARTIDLAIIRRAAIARCHHDRTAEMAFHGFQHGNKLWL